METDIKGQLFDMQTFSLNDGPGIRTTVFLKSCPLHCVWCHNPESIRNGSELSYFEERCTQCGDCKNVCPKGVHDFIDGKHILQRQFCKQCFHCIEVCPSNALIKTGEEKLVLEVFEAIQKDSHFFKSSGGGITISGGEPMNQVDFVFALFSLCKNEGIHTCLDTSGYASRKSFTKVLGVTDYILFDYKATNAEAHKVLTSVDNSLILDNFQYLYEHKKQIELRCPMIPGINDSREHLNKIASMEFHYPELAAISVLPYHPIANSKYLRYGYVNQLKEMPSVSEEIKNQWRNFFKEKGCNKVFIH